MNLKRHSDMIVHIDVGVAKENGKWIGRWTAHQQTTADQLFGEDPGTHEITANRREELERKLDKALRLAFPTANYIVQHREAKVVIDQEVAGKIRNA
jgi:argonaute-like protein implicated in RNA metabolism and viral defense